MKTKTVTIHNWDGSRQKVEAPQSAKYIEVAPYSGFIFAHARKPKKSNGTVYQEHGRFVGHCPDANRPYQDEISQSVLLKIEEV